MANTVLVEKSQTTPLMTFTNEDDKKSVNDDVLTEEDTDTEVEEDVVEKTFLNIPEKFENSHKFHPYQNTDEMSYHSTYYNDQASSNSKHEQELTSPNALCPPSHALKARRLSKNVIQSSTSTPIISSPKTKITRKHSFVDSANSNSAVSPRFMALRKLSEVTTLPSLSYSSAPPVPQIPLIYHQSSNGDTPDDAKSESDQDFENRIIHRIDDVLETQLQFHLGQVVWKSSESHLEARQFWEDQKKEMFGFAATLIDRLESHAETRISDDSLKQELQDYKSRCKLQTEYLDTYKLKYEQQQETINKYKLEYQQSLKSLNDYTSKYADMQQQIDALKAKQAELENQHKVDTDLLKQANIKIESHLETIAQLKESNSKLMSESRLIRSSRSASIVSEMLRKKSVGMDWADIMESEDEAKKSAEEWARKYRELQASYLDVCQKLDNNQTQSDDQSMIRKDEQIRHLKQSENMSRIQIEYLQSELNKFRATKRQSYRKSRQTVIEKDPGYVTEDGYLIFTTEINGKPSKYSIKIPNTCR